MRLQSLAAGFGVAAASLGVLATPAQASAIPAIPIVDVQVPEQVSVIAGHTKSVRAEVVNEGRVKATGVKLTFGSTGLPVDASLGLTLPSGCDASACTIGDLAPGARKTITFTLNPTAQTADNLKSTFGVSVSGDTGVVGYDSDVTVVRSAGGVDLEAGEVPDMKLDRGQSANVPLVVSNVGSKDVKAIAIVLAGETGLQFATKYKNCGVSDDEGISTAVCIIDQTLPAGSTFAVPSDTPVQVKLASDAGGPYTYTAAIIAAGLTDSTADQLAAKSAGKSGPTLSLKATTSADTDDDGDDINPDDNIVSFGVTASKSSADSAAVGATFTGKSGSSATIKVGVRNLGPTSTIAPSVNWYQTVQVTVPTNIELTKVDEFCMPGKTFDLTDDESLDKMGTVGGLIYTCLVDDAIAKGQTSLFTFKGTIEDGDHTGGKVVVERGVQDTDASNNTAAIGVTVKVAASTGDQLAITGAPAAWVAAGGALLVVAGVALSLVMRRRRIRTIV